MAYHLRTIPHFGRRDALRVLANVSDRYRDEDMRAGNTKVAHPMSAEKVER